MKEFEFISLARAEAMSEKRLQIEIGERVRYLREQLGVDAVDAANFVASLLNMGVFMNEKLKNKKTKENDK